MASKRAPKTDLHAEVAALRADVAYLTALVCRLLPMPGGGQPSAPGPVFYGPVPIVIPGPGTYPPTVEPPLDPLHVYRITCGTPGVPIAGTRMVNEAGND